MSTRYVWGRYNINNTYQITDRGDVQSVYLQGGGAKLQLPESQLKLAVQKREELLKILKPYFPTVLLDLETR